MDLYLRKVDHPQARDGYRVILKDDEGEIELGSIGIQEKTALNSVWHWGIDTVVPMRDLESEGQGKDRADCMQRFKAAWSHFAADEARLAEFITAKRRRR
jgi:hypothetical protein